MTAGSERTREGSGLVYAASPPIGWKYVKGVGGKRAVPDPEERAKVQEWLRLYQGGLSLESLYLRVIQPSAAASKIRGTVSVTVRLSPGSSSSVSAIEACS